MVCVLCLTATAYASEEGVDEPEQAPVEVLSGDSDAIAEAAQDPVIEAAGDAQDFEMVEGSGEVVEPDSPSDIVENEPVEPEIAETQQPASIDVDSSAGAENGESASNQESDDVQGEDASEPVEEAVESESVPEAAPVEVVAAPAAETVEKSEAIAESAPKMSAKQEEIITLTAASAAAETSTTPVVTTMKSAGTTTAKASATGKKSAAKSKSVTTAATATVTTSTYLKNAQSKYSVTAARTITATTPDEIIEALKTAGSKATASAMYIVYVPKGSYVMPKKLEVPVNVVFVAEKTAVFTPGTSSNFTQFFIVHGSIYGGTYKGESKAYYCLRFANENLGNKKNGHIEYAVVSGSQKAGIIAIGADTRFAYAVGNTVSNCGTTGISAVQGAWMATIKGNKITGCGEAGINIGHANVNNIINNTSSNNKGHGISTDIDGYNTHTYCHIHTVSGNTIANNGVNGVYIDKNCYVDKLFSRNTITGNGTAGLSIDSTGYVKAICKNTIKSNKRANLNVTGYKAAAYLGNSNVLYGAGTNNINIDAKGSVTLAGSSNQFNKASNCGISINGAGSFIVKSGKSNQIKYNKGFGIRVYGKSSCTLKGLVFGSNGGFAVKVYKGCKITQSGCGLSVKTTAKNRLYIEK